MNEAKTRVWEILQREEAAAREAVAQDRAKLASLEFLPTDLDPDDDDSDEIAAEFAAAVHTEANYAYYAYYDEEQN